MCRAMLVITPQSQQHYHRFMGEKTRVERFRDICENPPELQRCAVSYREVSTFWLILTQAGGLPATSVSGTGDCEMMGGGYPPRSQLGMEGYSSG